MGRSLVLAYGVIGYAVFFATFLYLIGFVTGLVVPRHVDAGAAPSEVGTAVAVDVALVALFGLQHSVMARPGFKARWTRLVPAPMERTTFVLSTCAVFLVLFLAWRPIPDVVWSIGGAAGVALDAIGWAGWGIVLLSTFLIDHFDLFGLRQTWLHFRGRRYTHRPFQARAFYRVVRHPLMLGFVLALFGSAHMTVGHLVLATSFFAYILIALALEERDLVAQHGDAYLAYRRQVPKLVPWPRLRSGAS